MRQIHRHGDLAHKCFSGIPAWRRGLLDGLRHGDLDHKCSRGIPAWRRGLLTGLRHGDLAHKYFSANPAWRRGLLTGLRHGNLAHKYFRGILAWRRGASDRSSARRPCPQVLQWHPRVAKRVFRPVFGTGTLPTGTPEASRRGETVISPTSLRLVTFTEQAHNAHRPLRGRLPCAVKPIGPHRANDYALHLPGRASADLTGKTNEGQPATGQANEGQAATGQTTTCQAATCQTTTCQAASCHPTTLQRRTRKRATNPVFRLLAALPIIFSNLKKISCVRFELDFRGQIFTRRRSIAVAM